MGQTAERVFHFSSTDTPQQIGEIATVIRSIGNISSLSTDSGQKTLSVHGTDSQVSLADWIFNELDQSAPNPNVHEYRLSETGDPDNVVRVFYLNHAPSLQQLQEVATLVRSVVEVRRLFTYNSTRAIVIRGTVSQVALSAWLIGELDKPAPDSAKHEYHMPGDGDDIVRVLYLPHAQTVQDFQEEAVLIRSIADIRRLFTYNAPKAIALRGTKDQMALAEWFVSEFDKSPAGSGTPREFHLDGGPENVVGLFYLTHAATPQRLQEIAVDVRTTTGVRRLFTYNAPRAMALRGTADQIAQAERLIAERDR